MLSARKPSKDREAFLFYSSRLPPIGGSCKFNPAFLNFSATSVLLILIAGKDRLNDNRLAAICFHCIEDRLADRPRPIDQVDRQQNAEVIRGGLRFAHEGCGVRVRG